VFSQILPEFFNRIQLRRIAARSGDPFAVQRLLGHADLTMATKYVQDISAQTDKVIENSRKFIVNNILGFL
jgi:integrase